MLFLKRFLGLPDSASNRCVLRECGQQPLSFYWFRCTLRFWNACLDSPNPLVQAVLRADWRLAFHHRCPSCWVSELFRFAETLGPVLAQPLRDFQQVSIPQACRLWIAADLSLFVSLVSPLPVLGPGLAQLELGALLSPVCPSISVSASLDPSICVWHAFVWVLIHWLWSKADVLNPPSHIIYIFVLLNLITPLFLRYKMRCMQCFVAPFLRWSLYGGIFLNCLRLCRPVVMTCTLL